VPFQLSLPGSPGAGTVYLRHNTLPVAGSSPAIQSRTPRSPNEALVRERHAIYLRRALGAPGPCTEDPILAEYSFCNIYREAG
jgi:hypothetical protein